MNRYLLTIEYDGTNYCGWQHQPNGKSVEDAIERGLFSLFGNEITIYGCGRTDAGVHAYGQTAHFDIDTTIMPNKLTQAINAYMPDDIRIRKTEKVADNFHARYDAKAKTYVYKLYHNDIISPIRRNYYHQVYGEIDIEAMQEACKYFVGTHDFYAFSSKSDKEDTVREIYDCNLTVNGDEISVKIRGNGFLYNMVRVIVGTIIEVGKGKIQADTIPQIFDSRNRTKSGKRITAEGLYLMEIEY